MRTISLCVLTLALGASLSIGAVQAQELTPPPPTAPAPPLSSELAPPPPPPAAPPMMLQQQQQPVYQTQPAPYYQPYPAVYVPQAAASARPRLIGYRVEQRSVKSLWAPGLVAFLVGWVLNFGVATPLANAVSNDRPDSVEQDAWAWSVLPIAGPLVELGIGAPHPAIPLVMLTLQAGGLALLIAGLVMKEDVRLPVYEGDPHDPNATRIDLAAIPIEGGAQVGLTLTHL